MKPLVDAWPSLPYEDWKDTLHTLHMQMQVIGKLRMAVSPPEPEWAHVALYLTARGLTTGPMPFARGAFDVEVDLFEHQVRVRTSDDQTRTVALTVTPVRAFYREFVDALHGVGIDVALSATPSEVPDPIPFPEDTVHDTYEPEWVERFWRVLSGVDLIFREHRARFHGRTTPVQFFWGSFDLALARYSGVSCDPPPNAGSIMAGTCDVEQVEAGFWAGSDQFPEPAFYAYGYPKAAGIESASVKPKAAFWSDEMGEFLLRYNDMRSASAPNEAILAFLESTYQAAASRMGWSPDVAVR